MELLGHLASKTEPIGLIKKKMSKKKENSDLKKKIENGKIVSPVLPKGVKNYLIDIDGTIGDDIPNEEPERMVTAKHYPDALKTLTIGINKVILFVFSHQDLKVIEK
mgnify:CR=1 FL=1